MSPAEINAELDGVTTETKIAVAAWLLKHLVEHAQDGGSFRELVYKRLKLPMAAYTPLLNAGGMTVSTHFTLIGKREPALDTARVPMEPPPKVVDAIRDIIHDLASDIVQGRTEFSDDDASKLYRDILKASGRDPDLLPPSTVG